MLEFEEVALVVSSDVLEVTKNFRMFFDVVEIKSLDLPSLQMQRHFVVVLDCCDH